MRVRSIVIALLLIPLLAVSAGAIYMEGQAPLVDDGQYHILAAESGLSDGAIGDGTPIAVDDATPVLYTADNIGKFPTCGIGCNVGKYSSGPIVTKVYIPPTNTFCQPCVSPCFTGCAAKPLVYCNVGSPKIVNPMQTGVMNNFCGLPQSCFAPIMEAVVPT